MASQAQEQQQATLQKFYSGLERQQAAAAAAGISAPNAERLIAQGDAQVIGGDILAYDRNPVDARAAYTDAYRSYAAAVADANGARAAAAQAAAAQANAAAVRQSAENWHGSAVAAAAGIPAPNAGKLIAQGDAQMIGGDILDHDGNPAAAAAAYQQAADSYVQAVTDANDRRANIAAYNALVIKAGNAKQTAEGARAQAQNARAGIVAQTPTADRLISAGDGQMTAGDKALAAEDPATAIAAFNAAASSFHQATVDANRERAASATPTPAGPPVPGPVSSSGAPARKPAPPAPAKEVAALLPGTGGGGPTVHAGNPHASTWQGTPEGVAAEHGWDQYRDTINIWAPRFRATLRALAHRAL